MTDKLSLFVCFPAYAGVSQPIYAANTKSKVEILYPFQREGEKLTIDLWYSTPQQIRDFISLRLFRMTKLFLRFCKAIHILVNGNYLIIHDILDKTAQVF